MYSSDRASTMATHKAVSEHRLFSPFLFPPLLSFPFLSHPAFFLCLSSLLSPLLLFSPLLTPPSLFHSYPFLSLLISSSLSSTPFSLLFSTPSFSCIIVCITNEDNLWFTFGKGLTFLCYSCLDSQLRQTF